MRTTESGGDETKAEAEIFQQIIIAIFTDKIITGGFIFYKIITAIDAGGKSKFRTGFRLCDTVDYISRAAAFHGRNQFPETHLSEARDNVIYLFPIEKIGVTAGVNAADNNGCPDLFLCFRGQFQHGVGFAGNASDADYVRIEIGKDIAIYIRHGLEINDPDVVIVEIARQSLKAERFAPEEHFQGIDTVLFFRDAPAAIGGIDKENLHLMSGSRCI